MKVKLISLTIIFTLITTLAFTQSGNRTRPSVSVLGGVNFQTFNGKDIGGNKIKNDMIIGYHIGLNVQLPIASQFYFQPGLLFTTKGSEDKAGVLTSKYKLSYIELPLNFVYKAELGGGYFMLGFGPYVAYGIGGKATYEGGPVIVNSDIKFKKTVEIGDPVATTYFKPFDAGGNIFFGYELSSGLFMQLNAQLGMLSVNSEDKRIPDNKLSIKNSGFGLSLGYRF